MVEVEDRYDFVSHVTQFCRGLRDHDMLVGPREISDALHGVGLVDVMDRARVYWALRSLLVSGSGEIALFDELFERFWRFESSPNRPDTIRGTSQAGGMREFRRAPRSRLVADVDSADAHVELIRSGASARDMRSQSDLTILSADELTELSRIAAGTVRALASRPGRRRRRHRRKGTPDLRGAFRLSLATGGNPVRLPRLRRVPRIPRLMVLLDVSGSMDRHVRLLLELLYAIGQRTKRVETFVFSTSVTRVTRQLMAPSFGEAMRRIGDMVDHWSGGTRIGESLARINAEYEAMQDRYTTVFVCSDGWETGAPEVLEREMRRMRRRVRRIAWLNPLLGSEGYEPLAGGLQAAMPHVDQFVPASDLAHLKRLPRLLRA